MFSFLKRPDSQDSSSLGYEEISEKKTTKVGYLLLILMAVFIIGISQTVFSDLSDIPEYPIYPSSCADFSTAKKITTRNVTNCVFKDIDKRFSIDTQFLAIQPILLQIASKNEAIDTHERSISSATSQISRKEREYELSLQEKMTDEQVLFSKDTIQTEIQQLRAQISSAQAQVSKLRSEQNSLYASINTQLTALKKSYQEALEYFQKVKAWYKLKVFALTLLYVVPFFLFSTRQYFKLKKKDSPYTIIFTALMGAFSILLLQVLWMFLYDIVLARWIKFAIELFSTVPFLRYILYYGGIIVTIAIFGGIVYVLQKKIFDPRKIALRRLKENKCPKCSFVIDRHDDHCASCGVKLKEVCEHCAQKRFVFLPHCPVCGLKKNPSQSN